MQISTLLCVLTTLLLMETVLGNVYERCHLARELRNVHNVPRDQLATWVCIAQRGAGYDTRRVSKPSKNGYRGHGLFMISDGKWCSPPGKGKGCGQPCSKFEDDNIADDVRCAMKIFGETKRKSGDGFTAWSVYDPHCRGSKAKDYIKNCF